MDGVDAVLCDISADKCHTLSAYCQPYSAKLLSTLQALCSETSNELNTMAVADRLVAETFAEATQGLLKKEKLAPDDICALGSHGQTIRHFPSASAQVSNVTPSLQRGFSCQIGDPNTLAALTGIDVVADFRRKDIALGGQGAPLVPAYHNAVFAAADKHRVLVNIGGIANISLLSPSTIKRPPLGFDTGPGNTLMDSWINQHLNQAYDADGHWAALGQVHPRLLTRLLSDPYFSQSAPKSTGKEYFNLDWLQHYLDKVFWRSDSSFRDRDSHALVAPCDIQATLLALTAQTIANEVKAQHLPHNTQIIICGGGALNTTLMQVLSALLSPYQVSSSHTLHIHPQQVEGSAFAWLAHAYFNNIAGNVPQVTGASRAAVLGGLYKAN